ncbi:hypothetical protein EDD16DRAFT_1526622 [Pisolithus croceorrhizus]|nr:hypothetical protein EDD16DRAFT_1526622 [Pisolithus croceorrhizus]
MYFSQRRTDEFHNLMDTIGSHELSSCNCLCCALRVHVAFRLASRSHWRIVERLSAPIVVSGLLRHVEFAARAVQRSPRPPGVLTHEGAQISKAVRSEVSNPEAGPRHISRTPSDITESHPHLHAAFVILQYETGESVSLLHFWFQTFQFSATAYHFRRFISSTPPVNWRTICGRANHPRAHIHALITTLSPGKASPSLVSVVWTIAVTTELSSAIMVPLMALRQRRWMERYWSMAVVSTVVPRVGNPKFLSYEERDLERTNTLHEAGVAEMGKDRAFNGQEECWACQKVLDFQMTAAFCT